ncbi:hypothetical protein F5146DRAFT_1134568 [Armillaria mellea]|nr:hypothetical protein F5146DRAFT_1134568 [Armillaria mellea]
MAPTRQPDFITRTSSKEEIEKLHKLYKTVFQQDVPAEDKSNHLRVFLAIYNEIGLDVDRPLSQVKWKDVYSIAGLDPARGREQLEHVPPRFEISLPEAVILAMQEQHHIAVGGYKLPSEHTKEAQHVNLASYAIRQILALFGSIIFNFAEEILPPSDASSGGAVELKVLPAAQQQVLALLMAELLSVGVLNRRQGYSFKVHGVVTDLKEICLYTYNPQDGKFSLQGQVHSAACRRSPEGDIVSEKVGLQQMMALVTRFILSLVLEGFYDCMEETLANSAIHTYILDNSHIWKAYNSPNGMPLHTRHKRTSYWSFQFSRYFAQLPRYSLKLLNISHTGFASSLQSGAEETYKEFTQDLIRCLLRPLWDSVKAVFPLTSSTEIEEKVKRLTLSMKLFNQAVEKLGLPDDLARTEGLQLLKEKQVHRFSWFFVTQRVFPEAFEPILENIEK